MKLYISVLTTDTVVTCDIGVLIFLFNLAENRKMNGIIGKDPEMFEEDLTKAFLTRLLDYHEKADLALGWRIPEHMASECHVHDSICLPTEGLLQDLSNCFKINDSKHLTVEWLKTFEDG